MGPTYIDIMAKTREQRCFRNAGLIWVMAHRYPKRVMVDGVFRERDMALMGTGEMLLKAAPITFIQPVPVGSMERPTPIVSATAFQSVKAPPASSRMGSRAAAVRAAVDNYEITWSPTASSRGGEAGARSVRGSTLRATIEGLRNGATYTFSITATNSAGTGPAATTPAVM